MVKQLDSDDLLEIRIEGFWWRESFCGCQETEKSATSAFGAQQNAEVA
jgi:hypothetical protein